MKLILASNSKSRKKLLESLKIDFIVQPSNTEEYSSALLHEEYCKQISFQKALAVAKQHDEGIILAADTMVHCEGKMYGKPKTVKEAKKNIRQLSGKTHDMVTVVTIIDLYQNKTISFSAVTQVTFSKITFAMMQKYLKKETNSTNYLIKPKTVTNEKKYKIKEMPEYDPNAELVSLSFTIPSWIESLDRVLSLSKYKTATVDVKNKVKKELHNLEFSIGTMLLALEE